MRTTTAGTSKMAQRIRRARTDLASMMSAGCSESVVGKSSDSSNESCTISGRGRGDGGGVNMEKKNW